MLMRNKRDQAWSVASYPCLGLWVFLQDPLVKLPTYEKALSCALAGGKVLDLGCCFGQDLRRFAIEGVPTEQMWALDRDKRLWDLGYELFRDRDKMKAHFLEEDAFQLASSSRSTPSAPVQQLPNDFSVILAFHFLHLFKWEDQLRLCEIIATLSKPGTIVLGSQMGSPEPRHLETPWGHMFLQSALTLKEMWRTAGKRTETAWTVSFTREIGIVEWGLRREDCGWIDARNREVDWVVERVR